MDIARHRQEENSNAAVEERLRGERIMTSEIIVGYGFLGMWLGFVAGAFGLFSGTLAGIIGGVAGMLYGGYVAYKK